MLRATLTLFMAYGAGTVLSFLRNVLIGRALSVEEFGIVGTFALAFAIIEMATYAGLDRMIVQDKSGDDPDFQANLQALQVARGLVGAGMFLLLAWPYAWFLGNLDIYWAYLVVAGLPLIRGFIHFDVYRLQRSLTFGPTSLVTVGGPAASLIAVAIFLPVIDSFLIMLVALFVQQGVFVALTHVVARQKWRIAFEFHTTMRALRFGIPLLINGVVVFAIHNGDLLLVGGFLGMEVLGWFYVATLITLAISMNLDATVRSSLLPGLSKAFGAGEGFEPRAEQALEFAVAGAIALVAVIYVLGAPAVLILFGADYAPTVDYLIPLAVLYAFKTAKLAPNVLAIARAETMLPVYSNLPRLVGLALAGLILWLEGGGIELVLLMGILGEFCSLALALWLGTRPARGLALSAVVRPLAFLVLILAAVVAETLWHPAGAVWHENLRVHQIGVVLLMAAATLALPSVRRVIVSRLPGVGNGRV